MNKSLVYGAIDVLLIIVITLSVYLLLDVNSNKSSDVTSESGVIIPAGIETIPFDVVENFPNSRADSLNFVFIRVQSKSATAFRVIEGKPEDSKYFLNTEQFFQWWLKINDKKPSDKKFLIYEESSNDAIIASILRFCTNNGIQHNYVYAIGQE